MGSWKALSESTPWSLRIFCICFDEHPHNQITASVETGVRSRDVSAPDISRMVVSVGGPGISLPAAPQVPYKRRGQSSLYWYRTPCKLSAECTSPSPLHDSHRCERSVFTTIVWIVSYVFTYDIARVLCRCFDGCYQAGQLWKAILDTPSYQCILWNKIIMCENLFRSDVPLGEMKYLFKLFLLPTLDKVLDCCADDVELLFSDTKVMISELKKFVSGGYLRHQKYMLWCGIDNRFSMGW